MQRITIEPITRIEGHARISLQLDEDGRVDDARFHILTYRFFRLRQLEAVAPYAETKKKREGLIIPTFFLGSR